MNKTIILFFIGLIMNMSGIFLSTKWIIVGTLIGISGAMLMGVSSYFIGIQSHAKKGSK